MGDRVIVRLYLPLEMGAVARICKTVASAYPDAVVGQRDADGSWAISADPDISVGERRRIARERRRPEARVS